GVTSTVGSAVGVGSVMEVGSGSGSVAWATESRAAQPAKPMAAEMARTEPAIMCRGRRSVLLVMPLLYHCPRAGVKVGDRSGVSDPSHTEYASILGPRLLAPTPASDASTPLYP